MDRLIGESFTSHVTLVITSSLFDRHWKLASRPGAETEVSGVCLFFFRPGSYEENNDLVVAMYVAIANWLDLIIILINSSLYVGRLEISC